jgi:hypothetical protein
MFNATAVKNDILVLGYASLIDQYFWFYIESMIQWTFFNSFPKQVHSMSMEQPFLLSRHSVRWSKNSLTFLILESSLPHWQETTTGRCHKPVESNPHHPKQLLLYFDVIFRDTISGKYCNLGGFCLWIVGIWVSQLLARSSMRGKSWHEKLLSLLLDWLSKLTKSSL